MTLVQAAAIDRTDYQALTEGAALLPRPRHGLLLLTGADRVDFLQRMTTNNIAALKPGQATVTVLTSPVARSLFAFTVLCREGDLLLLAGSDQAGALAKHLRGQIFFMDQVKVHDVADQTRLRLMGAAAEGALATLGFAPETLQPDGAWQEQAGLIALHQVAFDVPGYELIVPAAEVAAVSERLAAAGAHPLQDDAAYQARRVELGRPQSPNEINDGYTPLESGLAWTCAENKGCYTGQEIIARQITYDKVTKMLVGLTLDAMVAPGDAVKAGDSAAGTVTSAAYSPQLERPVALAVVKRAHNTPGTDLSVEGEEGAVPATVVELPFTD